MNIFKFSRVAILQNIWPRLLHFGLWIYMFCWTRFQRGECNLGLSCFFKNISHRRSIILNLTIISIIIIIIITIIIITIIIIVVVVIIIVIMYWGSSWGCREVFQPKMPYYDEMGASPMKSSGMTFTFMWNLEALCIQNLAYTIPLVGLGQGLVHSTCLTWDFLNTYHMLFHQAIRVCIAQATN